ncbi:hypothetical protein BCV70DRAFT_198176 [Testicularia cyperi]|uniref:Fatty acid hydroxylase domain-containing protein n=1 Tax=Testicularia cyperi TaxID=1882483 RepID=A0A317XUD2_9BASI|nr:hypothetical protein BCV70DRAFT_198176 [Testicularia cyperi]
MPAATASKKPNRLQELPQEPCRPSQGPLKSTWHQPENRSTWRWYHKLLHALGVDPVPPNYTAVKRSKTEPIPVFNQLHLHLWIISRLAVPLGIQYAYTQLMGRNMHPVGAYFLYSFFIKAFGINLIHSMRRLASTVGYLQAEHARDGVPDHSVLKVMLSLMSVSTFRPMVAAFITYDRNEPVSISPWIIVQIPAYALAVDFWFYWYHRIMHESDTLWKYHKTHHKTKRPTSILSLYADLEQEWFDVLGIPLLAYYTLKPVLPMNFYEWVICWTYIMFTELFGHSGIRAYGSPPAFTWTPLALLDSDLVIEDHDNHHSKGWKTSGNYGKGTRVWDRLFGTVIKREETLPELIDHSIKLSLPQY